MSSEVSSGSLFSLVSPYSSSRGEEEAGIQMPSLPQTWYITLLAINSTNPRSCTTPRTLQPIHLPRRAVSLLIRVGTPRIRTKVEGTTVLPSFRARALRWVSGLLFDFGLGSTENLCHHSRLPPCCMLFRQFCLLLCSSSLCT